MCVRVRYGCGHALIARSENVQVIRALEEFVQANISGTPARHAHTVRLGTPGLKIHVGAFGMPPGIGNAAVCLDHDFVNKGSRLLKGPGDNQNKDPAVVFSVTSS